MVNAAGDGIDSNGSVDMSGGVLLVSGSAERAIGRMEKREKSPTKEAAA